MAATELAVETTMTRHQRYYALHREEKLAKVKERYKNDPNHIARQQEKERRKAEKEGERIEKEKAKQEKKALIEKQKKEKMELTEKIRQEKLALALATRKRVKSKSETNTQNLDSLLGLDCPVSGKGERRVSRRKIGTRGC
ncbi:MAG: hypothetical protein EBR01_15010 [Proteobacteria bacterium]|nr:hypothetical protein [Pseudomonadota bacterium]